MLFDGKQTLVIVYKDELYCNFFRKLVETNDDISEESTVGTRDGSVAIATWNEKVWQDNKKSGNINEKIVVFSDVKEADKLLPIIDVKFNRFGIQYGWAGKQLLIYANPDALNDTEAYNEFFAEFCKLNISDDYKVNLFNITAPHKAIKNAKNPFSIALAVASGGLSLGVNHLAKKADDDKIRQQQYLYAIYQLYSNHLEEFMHN